MTLTKAFYMSPYEVTEELWDSVMGSGASTSQLPKVYVNWYEAVAFCNALSVRNGLTPAYTGSGTNWTWNQLANGYRLPTEAEWESACRAGSVTAFANGPITEAICYPLDPNLDAMGWYCGNAGPTLHNVGGKQANAWGLNDLHGNVWEWGRDMGRLASFVAVVSTAVRSIAVLRVAATTIRPMRTTALVSGL